MERRPSVVSSQSVVPDVNTTIITMHFQKLVPPGRAGAQPLADLLSLHAASLRPQLLSFGRSLGRDATAALFNAWQPPTDLRYTHHKPVCKPFLTPVVHRDPKIEFSQWEITVSTRGTGRRFFSGFGVCSDD